MEELQVNEYNDVRVLTTQQIADAYGTTEKVISNNFNNNKERYVAGKHFILLTGDELKGFKSNSLNLGIAQNVGRLYLWTEKGAFLHAKSLNTDEAWEVYDRLVDSYFKKSENILDGISTELKAVLVVDKRVSVVEQRVDKLENTMNIDYGQQKYLNSLVHSIGIECMGGIKSNAYKEIGGKVFKELSRDYNNYFNVNSRNNTPRIRYDEAVEYIKNWKPCTNTIIMINQCNAQIGMDGIK